MTLLASYGLDNYDDITEFTTLHPEWESFFEDVGPGELLTTGGRFGGGRLRMDVQITVAFRGVRIVFPTAQPKTLFFGVSLLTEDPGGAATGTILLLKDGSGVHMEIRRNPGLAVMEVLILGVVQAPTFTMSLSLWHRIEIKLTVDNAAGVVEVRLDDDVVFTASGIDTQVGSNAFTDTVDLQCGTTTAHNMNYDDITFNDDQGSFNTGFLGDVRIETLRPTSAGFVTDFTPSTGSNWENVDDLTGPDGDTTFNETSTATDQDLYNISNLTGTVDNIKAVVIRATARKDDAGARTIQLLSRTGGVTDVGATQTLLTSYSNFDEIHEVDPDTGVAWIPAGVNGSEIGLENN